MALFDNVSCLAGLPSALGTHVYAHSAHAHAANTRPLRLAALRGPWLGAFRCAVELALWSFGSLLLSCGLLPQESYGGQLTTWYAFVETFSSAQQFDPPLRGKEQTIRQLALRLLMVAVALIAGFLNGCSRHVEHQSGELCVLVLGLVFEPLFVYKLSVVIGIGLAMGMLWDKVAFMLLTVGLVAPQGCLSLVPEISQRLKCVVRSVRIAVLNGLWPGRQVKERHAALSILIGSWFGAAFSLDGRSLDA